MLRFAVTREFDGDFDWTDNKLWFRIKLVIELTSPDRTQSVSSDPYVKVIEKIFDRFGVTTRHFLHLGRNLGAKLLDQNEISADVIKRMGNWNVGITDKYYSTKLPMTGIRAMAGFTSGNGLYYNMRTTVKVSEELQKMTPIGNFVFDGFAKLANSPKRKKNTTAYVFLKFLTDINVIFLQDMAAMEVEHPQRMQSDTDGFKHVLCRHVDALNSDEFKVSSHLEHVVIDFCNF